MKVGRLPCQEEALREALAAKRSGNKRGGFSRRAMIVAAGGALCAGATGYWLGSAESMNVGATSVDPRILWARRMASEETPIEELLANALTFVRELMARSFDDHSVWIGVERICTALYEDPLSLPEGERRDVAALLSAMIRKQGNPSDLDLDRFLPLLNRWAK